MLKVTSAEGAVRIAAEEALRASLANTFAVGGALIDNLSGEVYCALHNNVLKTSSSNDRGKYMLSDPTAHGERQLVDWYFEHRAALKLPDPVRLTIVTTLDPCAMCAGAILMAGFNVAVAAEDGFAGINYDSRLAFRTLSESWAENARKTFGYYAVSNPVGRHRMGSDSIVFANEEITAMTYSFSDVVFDDSVNKIRALDSNSGADPGQLADPSTLEADDKIVRLLRHAYPAALQVRSTPRVPGSELAQPLYDAALEAKQRGASFNSVAFIDPFGNLLLCLGGREDLSPVRTAFMEVTRTYARIRWELMNDADRDVRKRTNAHFTHPKYGTFVFLFAPDAVAPHGLLEFGAFGSTMEGAIPQVYPSALQFVFLWPTNKEKDLANCAMNMPPFYTTDVQISPLRVIDEGLSLRLGTLIGPELGS
jgi:tRNA(Arg) A34 adenosine deaminase TadA